MRQPKRITGGVVRKPKRIYVLLSANEVGCISFQDVFTSLRMAETVASGRNANAERVNETFGYTGKMREADDWAVHVYEHKEVREP